ncbi:Phospholipid-transporting ATPase 1 [Hordeum vulgare]|nr:Phospholipid-transporting ATPase 1 [Hordeum vulgare]
MKIHGTGAATRGQGPVRVDAGEEDALESIARELARALAPVACPRSSCRRADGVILRPKTAVKTDPKLTALLKDGTGAKTSHARDLFLALATCNTIVPIVVHTVNPAAKLVEYQGESHDEQALVYAAMAYGHKLVERTSGHIVVAVFGTRQRYEHTTPPIRHDAPALASCLCDKLTM